MEKTKKYLNHLIQILMEGYLFVMFTVFPLYVGQQKYETIAYDKYELFMKASLILAGCFVLLQIVRMILCRKELKVQRLVLNASDVCVVLYALAVLISYLFAYDRSEALKGAIGWYTGFLTQAIMIMIFFLYSRFYHWNKRVIVYMMSGSFIVILLAVLNRFRICLIEPENYISTFISTIGNINWLASFLLITVSFVTGMYTAGIFKHRYTSVAAMIYLFFGYAALVTNGSNSVYPALLVMLVFMTVFGLSDKDVMKRVLICVIMFFGTYECLGIYGMVYGSKAFKQLLMNISNLKESFITMHCGAMVILIAAAGILYLHKRPDSHLIRSEKVTEQVLKYLCAAGLLIILAVLLIQVTGMIDIPDTFGHNRGLIWRLSRQIYHELPLYRKLIGVGPDSYGNYTMLDWDFMMELMEYYPNMRVTTAHSEPFTTLINLGIPGAAAYLAMIFSTVFTVLNGKTKAEKMYRIPVILALVSHHVNLLVSFQIVPVLPYLFLILGISRWFFSGRNRLQAE
ncbi:MAG: O-antigen ligase family protein [Solobacterium sp.]|nr:O-antigen ligase family protein [Solobacterium sp.]